MGSNVTLERSFSSRPDWYLVTCTISLILLFALYCCLHERMSITDHERFLLPPVLFFPSITHHLPFQLNIKEVLLPATFGTSRGHITNTVRGIWLPVPPVLAFNIVAHRVRSVFALLVDSNRILPTLALSAAKKQNKAKCAFSMI